MSPQMKSFVQKSLLIFLSVALTLLALEWGLRWTVARYGSQEHRIRYLYSLEQIQNLPQRVKPVPYLNYIADPFFPGHNQLGYRGEPIAIPKPQGVFRVVSLGGSTTYGPDNPDDAYPAQLQKRFHEQGYTHIEVINAGLIGYTSWESLANLAFRVPELEPDLILIYHATNDVLPRVEGSVECYRGLNELRGLNLARGLWVERDEPLPASAILRLVGLGLGALEDPLALDSSFTLPHASCALDPVGITPQQRIEENPPVYFARNIRNLVGLAQFNGVQPVISTWAYDTQNAERPDYWRQAIAGHNQILREIAAELGAPLIDFAGDLDANPAYWTADGIHMTAAGTREQARQYAAFLIAEGLVPPPDTQDEIEE